MTGKTFTCFRNLVSLKMTGVPNVTSRALASLVGRCPKLIKLTADAPYLAPEDEHQIAADRPLLQIIFEM
jgi:hypothetical protein